MLVDLHSVVVLTFVCLSAHRGWQAHGCFQIKYSFGCIVATMRILGMKLFSCWTALMFSSINAPWWNGTVTGISACPPLNWVHIARAFCVVRLGEVVLYWHDIAYVEEELWHKATTVVYYEFFRGTIVGHPCIHEVSCNFCSQDALHWDSPGHFLNRSVISRI